MIEIITSEITEDIKSFLLESLSFLKCGITKNFMPLARTPVISIMG